MFQGMQQLDCDYSSMLFGQGFGWYWQKIIQKIVNGMGKGVLWIIV